MPVDVDDAAVPLPTRDWLRLADPTWDDPLDPAYAPRGGGRWTPAGGPPTLYLNRDEATARANVRRFCARYSIQPEDLDPARGFELIAARLPARQQVADAVTEAGVTARGLPPTYPLDCDGTEVGWDRCQPIGASVAAGGLRGVWCRSAATADGSGQELAWYPRRQRAQLQVRRRFGDWYYA